MMFGLRVTEVLVFAHNVLHCKVALHIPSIKSYSLQLNRGGSISLRCSSLFPSRGACSPTYFLFSRAFAQLVDAHLPS